MKLIWFFLILLPLNQVLAQNLETGFVDSFLSYFNTPAVSENCDPILPHLSSCPLFLNQTTEQDQKSMLFTSISAEQDCSRTKLKEDFNSSREFEEFLKNKAPFKSLSPLPLLSGKCFSEGISPERKNELIAEYYNSAYRLESGLDRDLSALSTIDLLLGAKSLTGIDCADFSQTKALNTSCRELKACSNSNDAYLQQSAEDTLTALEGLASIDKKLKTLQRQKRKARRDGSLDKTKIEDLKKEKKNIENLYPWILGDKFKSQYDENKSYTVNEMSELIKAQLKDTRENLNVSLEDKSQAYNCVIYNSGCEELSDRDIRLSLAGSPSFDRESIFSSMEQLKAVRDEDLGQLSPSEKQALKQDLIAGSYFEQTQCREKIREDVRYVKKESALLALDVGLTFATVGLAGAAVTGRLAVKMGSKFAPNMTKAQRLQNLGLIGLDVSFTAPYAKEVMDQCEQDMDKLESLAVKETNDNSSLCQNQKSRIKHTSDLKNCILMASLVSLPITLPLAGVGVRVIAKRSNPALEQRKELAERSLGKSLSGKQVQARRLIPAEDDVLQKAKLKLENDLQLIRQSPEEPLLKAQGFKPEYYKGVDQAREFNRVKKYLQEIKADPEKTHIPYFSDQIEKTIDDFEREFRKSNQNTPEAIKHRLEVLENLKKEAQKRIANKEVTYNWWAGFNFKLTKVATIHSTDPPSIKNEDLEQAFLVYSKSFHEIVEDFPKKVMFFSTDDIGIMGFNRMGRNSYLVGVAGGNRNADGINMTPSQFFDHDIGHIEAKIYSNRYDSKNKEIIQRKDKEIQKILNNISSKSDREKAELALFMFNHEFGKSRYVESFPTDGSILTEKKNKKKLYKAMRYYLKKEEIAVLNENTGDLVRDHYKEFMPDHLKNAKEGKDEEQLSLFLDETLDIFMKNFSSALIVRTEP